MVVPQERSRKDPGEDTRGTVLAYSGLLLAVAGTAIARGEWRALLALSILFATLWWKLRVEERWMGEAFGRPQPAGFRPGCIVCRVPPGT